MGIKAVVFDYGNVLSLPQGDETMGLLASIADVDEATMAKLVWENRGDYDRGKLTGIEYYKKSLEAIGKGPDEGTLAALVRVDLESWANLNEDSIKLVDAVKAAGLKVGILSNIPHEFLALARKRFPLFKSADVGIFSCELGVNKPEKAIYDALLAALALPPSEVVFFDDLDANVAAAKDQGIHSFVWKDAASARAELGSLGVSV